MNNFMNLLIVAFLAALACLTSGFNVERTDLEKVLLVINGPKVEKPTLDSAPRAQAAASGPQQMNYTQTLDHFDMTNNETWQQRYWVDKSNFFGDGPVFLIVGDQAEATPALITNSQIANYANNYNALVVLVEHRFYGQSMPTVNMTTDDLKYLTIEQALEDLADIRGYLTKSLGLTDSNKWVAFGTLYSGNLAAWFRLKFPNLVSGAIASSAPILADFEADFFFENVANSITAVDPMCTDAIQEASDQLDDIINSQGGLQSLQTMFKTCSPIESNNDISLFVFNNAVMFSDAVEYQDTDIWPDELSLENACQTMTNKSLGTELERYVAFITSVMEYNKQDCQEVSYNSVIAVLSNVTDESGSRPYVYQYCTQLGQFQTTRSTNQPFGHHVSQRVWISLCNDAFDFDFDKNSINAAMDITNHRYGGLNFAGSNVAFVSGKLDPWRNVGITSSSYSTYPNANINVIEIAGVGSSADFFNIDSQVPAAVTEAKEKISVLIGKYILS